MAKKNRLPVAKASTPIDCPQTYKRTKEDEARERRYAVEAGLRAIQRAEEIKANKSLMSDIKTLAAEQVANLKKFAK
jgi:hypothetical protein